MTHSSDTSAVDPPDFEAPASPLPQRAVWASVKRGLRGRCPACGEGRVFDGYLKVNPVCPACGEELHHHRADDFPPYLTIFALGHILGAAMFAVDDIWPDLPMGFHFLVWPFLVVVLGLILLPMFKGGLIAYQWALRMHGFETAHTLSPESDPDGLHQRAA